jgi:hypothetical protein
VNDYFGQVRALPTTKAGKALADAWAPTSAFAAITERVVAIEDQATHAALLALRRWVLELVMEGGDEDYWEGINEFRTAVLTEINRTLGIEQPLEDCCPDCTKVGCKHHRPMIAAGIPCPMPKRKEAGQ